LSVETRAIEAGPVLCLFRRFVGLPCPACGLTRALVAAGSGDVQQSLRFHPLGLPIAFVALATLAMWPFRYVPAVSSHIAPVLEHRAALYRLAIAALFSVWAARLSRKSERHLLVPDRRWRR